MDSLQIHLWNANGILNKTEELQIFLENYNVRIMAVNETKICSTNTIKLRNYEFLRKDRDANGGGVAFIIRKDVSYTQILDNNLNHLELLQIKISNNITITTWYNPPNNTILLLFSKLNT